MTVQSRRSYPQTKPEASTEQGTGFQKLVDRKVYGTNQFEPSRIESAWLFFLVDINDIPVAFHCDTSICNPTHARIHICGERRR